MRGYVYCFVNSILVLVVCGTAHAGTTPITTERVASGLSRPVYVTHVPGDFTRVFVVEQIGRIRVYDITNNPPTLIGTFLDIQARVNDAGNEQGLLGMAFHPNFASNSFFYLNYTAAGGTTRVSRFSVPGGTPNAADPNSELIMLTVAQPESNHNGGWIDFGPNDGYLYIGMGDGGGANDAHGTIGNGQDMNALLGKMLRIDVDGNNGPGGLYGIPTDNPFFGPTTGRDEIWHVGLRNPWRNAFDQLTGDLYIADVGQNVWEEINFQPASSTGGENWGWRCREGAHNFNFQAHCSALTLLDPIHEFSHGGSPFRCSITGGEVYRGCAIPDLQGTYFFADFCSNQIWSFVYTGSPIPVATDRTAELAPGGGFSIAGISGFGRDAYGEIYICDLNGGEVFRIIPDGVPNACLCDPMADADVDTFNDCVDNCPNTANALQSDTDLDTDGDLCDSCPADAANACIPAGSIAEEMLAGMGSPIAAPDASASITMEPGAIAADTTIGITRLPITDTTETVAWLAASGDRVAEPVVMHDLTPDGQTFATLVSICLSADVSGVDPARLSDSCLSYLDEMENPPKWKCQDTCIENSGTLTCCGVTDHFSRWAAMVAYLVPAAPTAAPAPHDRRKNRYLSFVPEQSLLPYAIRVTKTTAPSGTCWAAAPDVDGNSKCTPTPTFRVWNEAVIHVGDCAISPVASYDVTVTAEGTVFSAPLTVETILLPSMNLKLWGDVVGVNSGAEWSPPNQFTNVQDVLAVLAYITNATVKPTFQQANLQAISSIDPCLNPFVNTADVLILVKAVAGDAYPFTVNPGNCPACP